MNHGFTHLIWITIILGVISSSAVHLLPKEEDDSVDDHTSEQLVRTKSWTQSSTSHVSLNGKPQSRHRRSSAVDMSHTDVINNRWWDDAKITLLKSGSSHNSGIDFFKRQADSQLREKYQRTVPVNNNGFSPNTPSTSGLPIIFSHLRAPGRSPTYFLQETIGLPKNGLQYFVAESYSDHHPSLSNNQDFNHTASSKDGIVENEYGKRIFSGDEVRERLTLPRETKRRRTPDHRERVTGFLEPQNFFTDLNSSSYINVFNPETTEPSVFNSLKKDDNATEKTTATNIERNLLEEEMFTDEEEILRRRNNSNSSDRSSVEYVVPGVNYVAPKVDYVGLKGEFLNSKVRYLQPEVLYIEPKVDYEKSGVEYVHPHIDDDFDEFVYQENPQQSTVAPHFQWEVSSLNPEYDQQPEITSDFNRHTETSEQGNELPHSAVKLSGHFPGETYYYDPISPDLEVTKFDSDFEFHEPETDRRQHQRSLLRSDGRFHFSDIYSSSNTSHNQSDVAYEGLIDANHKLLTPLSLPVRSLMKETAAQDIKEKNSETDLTEKKENEILRNGKTKRTSSRLTLSDNDAQNIDPSVIMTSRRSDSSDSSLDDSDRHFDNSDKEPVYETANASIWGTPEVDFPAYDEVPETGFKCADRRGYYGDVTTRCQVFHVCQGDGRKDSFLCPIGTVFHQRFLVCDWWYNVDCDSTPKYYDLVPVYFDDNQSEDNVNSAATYDTQKPTKALLQEKRDSKQLREEDLGTANRFVGGLKPFLPTKGFPIQLVKYTPIQRGHQDDHKLPTHLKSSNIIVKNPPARLLRVGVISISKAPPKTSLNGNEDERNRNSYKLPINYSMNKTERGMVEKAFSMGEQDMKVSMLPRKVVLDDQSEWWKDSGVHYNVHSEGDVGAEQFREAIRDSESNDPVATINKSVIRKKIPLIRITELENKTTVRGERRGIYRGKSKTIGHNGITTTPTPPVTLRVTVSARIPSGMKYRVAGLQRGRDENEVTSPKTSIFRREEERAELVNLNLYDNTSDTEEKFVTFPTTKTILSSTTESYVYQRPLKVQRTSVSYPLETTTRIPATSTTRNNRVLKIRKHSRFGARLVRPGSKTAASHIITDSGHKKKFGVDPVQGSGTRSSPRGNFNQKFGNSRRKYNSLFALPSTPVPNSSPKRHGLRSTPPPDSSPKRHRLPSTPAPDSSPKRHGIKNSEKERRNSTVEVRMGTKVTISMDSGGKSVSPPGIGGDEATENPGSSPWDESRGSQRLKYIVSKVQEGNPPEDIQMSDIESNPHLLKNYTVSVRRVTNDYTSPSNDNIAHRKRSLHIYADQDVDASLGLRGNNTRNIIEKEISFQDYKSNIPSNYSKNQGRNTYYEDISKAREISTSYVNESTNSAKSIERENIAGKTSVGHGGFMVVRTTTRKKIDETSTPFTPTINKSDDSLGAKLSINNVVDLSTTTNTRNDIITLHKKPEVHKKFGERFELLNSISTQRRSPAQLENVGSATS